MYEYFYLVCRKIIFFLSTSRAPVPHATGWEPDIITSPYQAYRYKDFMVLQHKTIETFVRHHPSHDTFYLGLSAESAVWKSFPEGATYCDHTQSLSFFPHRLKSCLLHHVATLECTETGPLRCGGATSTGAFINGEALPNTSIVVGPFGIFFVPPLLFL